MTLSVFQGSPAKFLTPLKMVLAGELEHHEGGVTLLMAGGRSVPLMFDMVHHISQTRDGAILLADERVGPGAQRNGPGLVREAERCGCAWPLHLFTPGDHLDRGVMHYEALFATLLSGPLVAILSVGEDGHIASLFPGHAGSDVPFGRMVIEHDAPKEPPDRVSFSLSTFQNADVVILLFMGETKKDAYKAFLGNAPSLSLPLAALREHRKLLIVTDLEED